VDLDKAPKDADGRVVFSADLYILRPLPRTPSNGVALVDVVNRGRKMTLNGFNRGGSLDPATETDLGDGFLMRHGFTLVWVGWQFDVRREDSLMGIDVPGIPATAPVRAVFTPNDRSPDVTIADLAGYSPVDGSASLTVRDGPYGPVRDVPRDRWRLAGSVVSMPGGFEPGRTYEIVVRTTKAPLAGLGLVALRDVGSWLKHPPAAAAPVRHAIAFGSSQSGRFLRTFMYRGFSADEKDRLVYDGVMAHIAGAGKLSLNDRGATPNALSMFDGTAFPYADKSLRDPISGRTDGLLENDRARRHQPKVFYTNSAVEYWGGGRSAALLHTTPDGKADLELPANVRV
jgi:Alpha/beta hydrolase domain